MGQLLYFPDRGLGSNAVQQEASDLTFEQIADQWNMIPGVLPVRFSDVQAGQGVHKAVMAALKKHPGLEWWIDLFGAVYQHSHTNGWESDFEVSLSWVLKAKHLKHFLALMDLGNECATSKGVARCEN